MANFINGFLDGLAGGATNPKGNLGDYAHAARLYTDDSFKLAPKTKYLYHVVFETSDGATALLPELAQKHKTEINMLVKEVDLPKYSIDTTTKNMYNRKKNVQTGIEYDPINITFHDDNHGVTTAFMEAYYRYHFRDGNLSSGEVAPAYNSRNTYKTGDNSAFSTYRYGFDTDNKAPFFKKITIYQMSRKSYVAYTLVNPVVTGFQHDSLEQSDNSGTMSNQMTVVYEAVFYSKGTVGANSIPGFGESHYDKTPSPLSLSGGSVASLFGVGGAGSGVSSVLGDITSGNFGLSTILTAVNTGKSFSSLTKEGLKAEGMGILSGVLGDAKKSLSGLANTQVPTTNDSSTKTESTGGSVDTASSAYQSKVQEAMTLNTAPTSAAPTEFQSNA